MFQKYFLFFVFSLIMSFNVYGQDKLEIGLNFGLNYPSLRGYDFASNQNFRIGFLIGSSLEYELNNHFSLKGNINYERRVDRFQITFFNNEAQEIGNDDFREIFSYINFPILLNYKFNDSGYFINSGPFANYLIEAKFKPDYPNEERDRGNSSEIKKLDFGLSLGIGKNFKINDKNNFVIEIRDDFGLIDTGGVPNQFDGTSRTNSIKLILNWSFGI